MIKECDVHEFKKNLENNKNIQYIDCREGHEWNEARIEGVTLLPLSEFEAKFETILKDKNIPIVIHCRSGARSMNACMFLMSKGYADLTNVRGGIISWEQAGYPIIAG